MYNRVVFVRMCVMIEQAVVAEGVRCAAMANAHAPLPVYPYAWHYYHNGKDLLPAAEVAATLARAAAAGAAGVVVWGGGAQAAGGNASAPYWRWLRATGGPATKAWCDARPGGC